MLIFFAWCRSSLRVVPFIQPRDTHWLRWLGQLSATCFMTILQHLTAVLFSTSISASPSRTALSSAMLLVTATHCFQILLLLGEPSGIPPRTPRAESRVVHLQVYHVAYDRTSASFAYNAIVQIISHSEDGVAPCSAQTVRKWLSLKVAFRVTEPSLRTLFRPKGVPS
jgi:hypothetical protein